jgi:hypothetical protein
MSFEPVAEPDAWARPLWSADELYATWSNIYMKGKGSSARIGSMEGNLSPAFLRTGSSEIQVDTNGDGAPEKEVPVTGNLELVELEIGEGGERRPWALLAMIGSDRELYQGIEVNLAPQQENFPLYFVPAASVVGQIGDTPVRVFDDNADGVYGSAPRTWEHLGLTKDHSQPEIDSILVGKEKRARPWSEYVKVGDTWYQLAANRAGMELQATPVQVETGTLELKFAGGEPSWVVVRGKGRYENAFFDLAGGKVEVPVGTWQLYFGEVRKGKKRQMMKTLILPGRDTPDWSVGVGGTTAVALGAPFGFGFNFTREGETLIVEGRSVVVTGSANERYERPWNCVARPAISYRKAGTKKGSKPEDMAAVLDQETLYGDQGWVVGWFPMDTTIALKGHDEQIEVQLVEKKHRLFGSVESAWRAE